MTEYSQAVSSLDRPVIAAGIAALARALAPYRDQQIITKKLFGVLSISITIGQVLDWLTSNFTEAPAATPPTT